MVLFHIYINIFSIQVCHRGVGTTENSLCVILSGGEGGRGCTSRMSKFQIDWHVMKHVCTHNDH